MSRRIDAKTAAARLREAQSILILTHRRPDGDTAGSCAALCLALRALGKEARVYANPQFTPKFASYLAASATAFAVDGDDNVVH